MNDAKSDKVTLNKVKQLLDGLYDIDMLCYILEDESFYEIFSNIFPVLCTKYLTSIDSECEPFSEDSEEVKTMGPVEWFGKDHGLVVKDNEYFLVSPVVECGAKYWYIDKINTNNLERVRKIVSAFEYLGNINSFRKEKMHRSEIDT
jgi:hypothetical protein